MIKCIGNAFSDDIIGTRNHQIDSELLAQFDEPRKVEHVMVNVADALYKRSAAVARHNEHAVVLVGQFPHKRMFSGTLANDKNAHDDHKRGPRAGRGKAVADGGDGGMVACESELKVLGKTVKSQVVPVGVHPDGDVGMAWLCNCAAAIFEAGG